MKIWFKIVVLFLLNVFKPTLSGVSILMYHSIGDDDLFFTVRPDEFRRQMDYLSQRGYIVRVLTDVVEDLVQKRPLKPCVIITFDDGYKNFLKNALPVLTHYHFPATIFISTNLIGSDQILNSTDIKTITSTGLIQFMPHTANHRTLHSLSKEDQLQELESSLADLRKIILLKKPIISYPKGRYTNEVILHAKKVGYQAGVTVQEGIIHSDDNIFTLKRNSIDRSTTFTQFKAKISDAIEVYSIMKKKYIGK